MLTETERGRCSWLDAKAWTRDGSLRGPPPHPGNPGKGGLGEGACLSGGLCVMMAEQQALLGWMPLCWICWIIASSVPIRAGWLGGADGAHERWGTYEPWGALCVVCSLGAVGLGAQSRGSSGGKSHIPTHPLASNSLIGNPKTLFLPTPAGETHLGEELVGLLDCLRADPEPCKDERRRGEPLSSVGRGLWWRDDTSGTNVQKGMGW